jgi:anthranilate phosphoribosyltransferase
LTSEAFEEIMSGNATEGQIGAFLIALQINGVNKDHVIGALKVMQKKMIPVKVPKDAIDTCGTGGDSLQTFNVSTISAIIASAAGARVAKHGGRSVSSKCGSADVLEKIGVNVNLTHEQIS